MEIRKCTAEDVRAVGEFYDRVILHMDETGTNFPKWEYKCYPCEQTVREKTARGEQYVCLAEDGSIVGAFVLDARPHGRYDKAAWSRELQVGEYMVCHALASDPAKSGRGIGRAMVEYCIERARTDRYRALRLDVVPENTPARRLYEKCGMRYVGDVDLEAGLEDIIPLSSMYEINL